ncbi:acylphosphatase [Acidobacteriota bacterium]
MNSRAHIHVSGRVQGVFYREHARKWAVSLHLKGWARNLPDGRVEVIAEGDRSDLASLIHRLTTGSPMSRVEDIQTNWEEYTGDFPDFRVTY